MFDEEKKDNESNIPNGVYASTDDSIKSLLLDAANYYENDGKWIQHKTGNKQDGYCILGVLDKLKTNSFQYLSSLDRIRLLVSHGDIISYNDDRHRTKADIIDLLRSAAVR